MKYLIDPNNRPIYLQLYRLIREDIVNGVYPYRTKLPSKRGLAQECGVSTLTVEHAYALLCDEGYAEGRARSGYVVIFRRSDGFAASVETASPRYPAIASEQSGTSFPLTVLSKTIRRVLAEHGELLLRRSPGTGTVALRDAIMRYLARNRGITVSLEQIVIGSGSEHLYGLIVELLGREKVFAIEHPSYKKIEQVYRAEEIRYLPLPLTETGIDSDALTSSPADVLHTTPYRSYPSGVTASASKRHEYVHWASTDGRYIIEDDFESEFSVFTKPTETLFSLSPDDNVIYLNSFSKTISPSLRVAYMVLPKHLVLPYERKLGFYASTVPTFWQYVLAELINNGDFERHINRVRRSMRKEADHKRTSGAP